MSPEQVRTQLAQAQGLMGHLHATMEARLQQLLKLLQQEWRVVSGTGLHGTCTSASRQAESRSVRAVRGCVVCHTTEATRYCRDHAFYCCVRHWDLHQRLAHAQE